MIFKLAIAALISGIAIPALAIHHLGCIHGPAELVATGADSTVSAVGSLGGARLDPFLSGLI